MGQNKSGEWTLAKSAASLKWQDCQIELDVSQPAEGAALGEATRLLQAPQLIVTDSESLDPYARSRDLIVKYPSSDARRVGAELYWRWSEIPGETSKSDDGNALGTLELIYSLETEFLDTQPDPVVESIIEGKSYRWVHFDGESAFTLEDEKKSFPHGCVMDQTHRQLLLAVIPSDLRSISVEAIENDSESSTESIFRVSCQLNSDFLEKGVIRRLRLLVVIGGPESESQLLAAANDFLNSEVPLTA